MKTLAERRADYKKVSKKIKELGSEGLAAMLKDATQVHSGIGGTAVKLFKCKTHLKLGSAYNLTLPNFCYK